MNAAPGEDYHVLPFTTVPRCEHGSEHCDLADEEDDDEVDCAALCCAAPGCARLCMLPSPRNRCASGAMLTLLTWPSFPSPAAPRLMQLAAAKAANKVVGWDTIPIQSVDSLLSMHQIEWVDVLKIDAGGERDREGLGKGCRQKDAPQLKPPRSSL